MNTQNTLVSNNNESSVSSIIHDLGLVCSEVTDEHFEMFLYVINTKIY